MFHELAAVSFRLFTRLLHSVRLITPRQQAGAELKLAEGGKNEPKGGRVGGGEEKKVLKKTELAKLYFKVGWHIRGTSSYSSAFLRDIYARILQHPKRAFSSKPGRGRPKIRRRAPRPNYPLDHNRELVPEEQRRERVAISEDN